MKTTNFMNLIGKSLLMPDWFCPALGGFRAGSARVSCTAMCLRLLSQIERRRVGLSAEHELSLAIGLPLRNTAVTVQSLLREI